eukprot:7625470-Pyramimonas_sp.AAC.1
MDQLVVGRGSSNATAPLCDSVNLRLASRGPADHRCLLRHLKTLDGRKRSEKQEKQPIFCSEAHCRCRQEYDIRTRRADRKGCAHSLPS